MTSKKTHKAPNRGSHSDKIGPHDRHFQDLIRSARKDLDALDILWPALRRQRLGYTVLSASSDGLDPGTDHDGGVASDRDDLRALLTSLAALDSLAAARRLLESRGEAMAARLLGEGVVCPVCIRTVTRMKDNVCAACYQSLYDWRNRRGNIGRDRSEWVAWRRENLK